MNEIATGRHKLHRAYYVFFGVCLMLAGGTGLVLNVVGNYFVPIAIEFFGTELVPNVTGEMVPNYTQHMTQVVLMMTIYAYTMVIWLPFAGRLFSKVDGRLLYGGAGLLVAIATGLMGVWNNLQCFYISAVCWGLGGPILFSVGPSVLINNWFAPHKAGKMLGIASAFTGVGTFVWTPVFTSIINSQGYRVGFFIESLLVVALVVLPAALLFHTRPQDIGLSPCGDDDPEELKKKAAVDANGGIAPKVALMTVAFYLLLIAGCIISLGGGYKSTMPAMVISTFAGADPEAIKTFTTVGGTMIMAAAIGNIIGKILLGYLTDKVGIVPALAVFIILSAVGYVSLIVSAGNRAILLIGGFGLGTGDALLSVGMPLATRTVFGLKHYAKIFSFVMMGASITGGLGVAMVTYIAKATGGYTTGYILGITLTVIAGISLIGAVMSSKSLRTKWEE